MSAALESDELFEKEEIIYCIKLGHHLRERLQKEEKAQIKDLLNDLS